MQKNNVTYEVLISGIPFKTEHGGFGYCSITLIKDGEDIVLFDVGHYAVRGEVLKIMEKYNVKKVFLSHLHYDHCVNADLFCKPNIKIYLNKKEFNYLNNIQPQDIYTYKPFKDIVNQDNLILFDDSINITENVKAIETIGHSAGHSSLVFKNGDKNIIIAGDAIKTNDEYAEDGNVSIKPYNSVNYNKTKHYIKQNFDVIILGHDSVIEGGVHRPNDFKTIPL